MGKRKTAGNRDNANASSDANGGASNASEPPDASANAKENPARNGASGNIGNTGNRSGDFSELAALLSDRPDWLCNQARKCLEEGAPKRLLKPLASTVASEYLGDVRRWEKALPFVRDNLEELAS